MKSLIPKVYFDANQAQEAHDTLGANCGPGAIAGMCLTTPEKAVAAIGQGFLDKGYTTENMLRRGLQNLNVRYYRVKPCLPGYGICRVNWRGPWSTSKNPIDALRHSHWIGAMTKGLPQAMIFDINAISVGGWIPFIEWKNSLVPWLLKESEPEANGEWYIHETLELILPN